MKFFNMLKVLTIYICSNLSAEKCNINLIKGEKHLPNLNVRREILQSHDTFAVYGDTDFVWLWLRGIKACNELGEKNHHFFGHPVSAGRGLWNSVSVFPSFGESFRPSFRLSVSFLGIGSSEKCPKDVVFRLFKKITLLDLSGVWVKSKFLWFINILRKLHAWEKSTSQVIAKNVSWSMRFQYSLLVNISLID